VCALHSATSASRVAIVFQPRTYSSVCPFTQGVSSRNVFTLCRNGQIDSNPTPCICLFTQEGSGPRALRNCRYTPPSPICDSIITDQVHRLDRSLPKLTDAMLVRGGRRRSVARHRSRL